MATKAAGAGNTVQAAVFSTAQLMSALVGEQGCKQKSTILRRKSSAVACSNPVTCITEDLGAEVTVYVDAPVIEGTKERRIAFFSQLLGIAVALEAALAAPNCVATVAVLRERANVLLRDGAHLYLTHRRSLQEALEEIKLEELFPLCCGKQVTQKNEILNLSGLSVLGQVVTLATQLRQDIELPNHKYIAHQIALLYQSLTNAPEDLRVFRTEIEAHFDAAKAACSSNVPEPLLSCTQREWLRDMCTRILSASLYEGKVPLVRPPQLADFLASL